MGNWEQYTSGTEIQVRGKHAIIARNGAILEVSLDQNNWENVHVFPADAGELFVFEVPSATWVRVTGGGQWAIGKFNEMSG